MDKIELGCKQIQRLSFCFDSCQVPPDAVLPNVTKSKQARFFSFSSDFIKF